MDMYVMCYFYKHGLIDNKLRNESLKYKWVEAYINLQRIMIPATQVPDFDRMAGRPWKSTVPSRVNPSAVAISSFSLL